MIRTIKQDDLEIKMIVDTEFEDHRFVSFFDKEPETIEWVKTFIKPGDIFFDVGANIGVFSLLAAALFKKKIMIYAFEPVYHNFDKLCRNIMVNNFNDFFTPYCLAIGDETKLEVINLASSVSGSANHMVAGAPEKLATEQNVEFKQGIIAISFDDLAFRFQLPLPNHIKIDTDGFEEKIVKGAEQMFSDQKVRSVLIEITDIDGSKERIIGMMDGYGFNTKHSINFQENHSRFRREKNGKGNIENIIFTK
jgi:FkbM family methyltransferase